jgi:hypothetical protein
VVSIKAIRDMVSFANQFNLVRMQRFLEKSKQVRMVLEDRIDRNSICTHLRFFAIKMDLEERICYKTDVNSSQPHIETKQEKVSVVVMPDAVIQPS